MNAFQKTGEKMTNYRWTICAMLFFATTVNYLDRQVSFIDLGRIYQTGISLE